MSLEARRPPLELISYSCSLVPGIFRRPTIRWFIVYLEPHIGPLIAGRIPILRGETYAIEQDEVVTNNIGMAEKR
jgi:hypothetical protein